MDTETGGPPPLTPRLAPADSLLKDKDFLRLWAGQTISLFGSLLSRTTIPFTAALVLKATPAQVAWLAAADLVPGLLVGLFAGAWADRVRRKPLLIGADIARALLLTTIPLLSWQGVLRMEHLLVVGLITGVLNTLFDVAYGAYLPTLVGTRHVAESNARLTATASAAEVGAFGISGWLVQWFGAPVAIGIDAASFLLSALSLAAIRRPEPHPAPAPQAIEVAELKEGSLRQEILEGMRVVAQEPLLRVLVATNLLLDFSFRLFGTLIILFITNTLKVPPSIQGMVFALGGVMSLLGALAIGPITRHIGFGNALTLGVLAAGVGILFVPLAPGATALGISLLILNQVVTDPGYTIFEIHQTSLRQSVTPNHLRGRVEATFRFLGIAARLLGLAAAGYLGERLGLRSAMLLGATGACLAALPLALSPVRRMREIPGPLEDS